MLCHSKGRLWPCLVDYALRFRSQSLVRRLGCLADLLSLPGRWSREGVYRRRSGARACCLTGSFFSWKERSERCCALTTIELLRADFPLTRASFIGVNVAGRQGALLGRAEGAGG
jgi:hypothetical protein